MSETAGKSIGPKRVWYEARLLNDPSDPEGTWQAVLDEDEDPDFQDAITGDSFEECLALACDVLDNPKEDVKKGRLVIARVEMTYLRPSLSDIKL
jgi:hypothetical protein